MQIRNFRNIFHRILGKDSIQKTALPNLEKVSELLDYSFTNEDILLQSLKHRSYLTITGEKRIKSNERLELLGDAVLGLVVTDYLYHEYPDEEEGNLTNFKSLLVNHKILSTIGRDFGLGSLLLLNEAEERSGGRERESILADAIEAIIGAIYLDGGLDAATKFIHSRITVRLTDLLANGLLRNYKSLLQEYCQSLGLSGPFYNLVNESGPDHYKTFTIAVSVNEEKLGFGEGHSKKNAEQKAAREALNYLKVI